MKYKFNAFIASALLFTILSIATTTSVHAAWWKPTTWKIFNKQKKTLIQKTASSTQENPLSCNGSKYKKCPEEQIFICPANGEDAFCEKNKPDEIKAPKTKEPSATAPAPKPTKSETVSPPVTKNSDSAKSATKTCLDGKTVSANDYCTKVCANGEVVVETLTCLAAPQNLPIPSVSSKPKISSLSVNWVNGSQSNAEYKLTNNSSDLITISGIRLKVNNYPEISNHEFTSDSFIKGDIGNTHSEKVSLLLDNYIELKFENPFTLMPFSSENLNFLMFTTNLNPCQSIRFELSEIKILTVNINTEGLPISNILQRPCN